jgi:1-acyl-sn-glycerol-3-phosphate acyltransferase
VTALPEVSGVPHPATWPFYPHRWFGRFMVRRRFSVVEHASEHVPADGPVILAANHIGVADGPVLGLFGPRRVHVPDDPGAVRTHLRVLADDHAIGVLPDGDRGGEVSRFHRGAAYLALVSGAPVVPVTFLRVLEPGADAGKAPRKGRLEIVYGAPYRTTARPWPRSKKLVEVTSFDLRVHMLVALDAARTLTGHPDTDPPTGVTPGAHPGGTP